jgi:hypothetical protein
VTVPWTSWVNSLPLIAAPGVAFIARAVVCLGGAECVGDALVHGISLPVDAVRVDLQQDRDAVPGAERALRGGHPGVQPQRHRRVPQVAGRPTQG